MPSTGTLLQAGVEAAVMVVVILILTRINGLRSFSKMSGHDFVITVAMGSVLASVVVGTDTVVAIGIAAIVALFVVQSVIGRLRTHFDVMRTAVDNTPLLVMEDGAFLDHNLTMAKLTRADLIGKLREANVLRLDEVRAVVFEPTGDISVLHGDRTVQDDLLEGVRR
ncbi:Protein of unknown function [Pseudosulfitobacter pseudonitzschiae]|uniref:YetF C-terminal domain-containing protein n=1 Tax=Pseudosulfitobacter pseudonitzschiae TaxID=1402135 RepID=A0A073J7G6_9RHOB|nr:YetF domain-containing protein [Pseudosulfitobacter pseudonitzschiae]KEJ97755.1 hypothetical protein SUH3_01865 [Pseudosulfitobacter pseudonitzschiae]QKS09023.1 DUF421 domain-containing protein [Pseudosulfitobacter pseudonitzschiae]SHE58991.1 Protein of unknown function [Pseudosulfitobacter pseudonitzschiae]